MPSHPPLWAPLGLTVGLVLTNPTQARELAPDKPFQGGVVMELCRAGFDAAMTDAGKIPPAGMADWTCSCFLTEVREGQSLAGAENHCRSLASRRYRL